MSESGKDCYGPVTWDTVATLEKGGFHELAEIARYYARQNEKRQNRLWRRALRRSLRKARSGAAR